MISFTLATSAPQENLRRLLIIRGLFMLVVCATLTYSYWQLELALPYNAMLWIISALTLINLVTLVQLRFSPNTSEINFCSQLLIDIIGVTLLLFFAGGADNPFVSYYLVPLCIAAATLSWRLTWPLLLLSLCLYTSLFFFKIPLPDIAPHHSAHQAMIQPASSFTTAISFHTVGMWINFLVSALLVTYFVIKMAASLRQQDDALARLKEDKLRDEQLMAVATLAAGTAHELATPLTTIKTLLSEMQADYASQNTQPLSHHDQQGLADDLTLLQTQVSHCSHTLSQLTQQASALREGILPLQTVRGHCEKVIDDWLLLRPEVDAHIAIDPASPDLTVRWQPTIAQSMSNLLNNAADANPLGIDVSVSWDSALLRFTIHDKGAGVAPHVAQNLGKAFITDKGEGRGLGLFLTQAAIERYDGEVTLSAHPNGGTLTTLTLPLSDSVVESNS